MRNKKNYLIEDKFLGEGIKAIFSKKSFFSGSYFLMMNQTSKESFERLEEVVLKKEGIKIQNLFVPNAEHTSNVVNLDNNFEYKYAVYGKDRDILLSMPKELCDAIYTRDASKNLIIMPADCCCIGLYDYSTNLRAIIHAGWRGIKENIIQKTMEKLKIEGLTLRNTKAICFPSISYENYEIDEKIAKDFAILIQELGLKKKEYINKMNNNSYYLNLKELQLKQLEIAGISKENTFIMNYDTFSAKEQDGNYSFHSYRRDKLEWRNIAILTGEKEE